MLEQQPAAGLQMLPGLGRDAADVVESVGTAGQRRQRLVPERGQVRVVGADIGRVADDQLEARGQGGAVGSLGGSFSLALGPAGQPAAEQEAYRQLQPAGVGTGHSQRVAAGVERPDLGIGPALLQRQRNRAAAGAEVEQARGLERRQHLERPVDQGLGVGARIEHTRIDQQLEAMEFALADQIGYRLARQAAAAQRQELLGGGRGQRIGVVRDQPGPVVRRAAEPVQQQHLGVELVESGLARLQQGLLHRCR